MAYAAHIRASDKAVQTVGEHCKNTASLAESYLVDLDLANVGKIIGLLHDAGKLTKEFDDYINGVSKAARGSIDHSYAGAKYLADMSDDERKAIAGIGLAHTIISHHGLHDWVDDDCRDYYKIRTSKNEGYNQVLNNLSELIGDIDLDTLFNNAAVEWLNAANRIKATDKTEFAFYVGMLERLLLSALIDADRTDTSDFMSNTKTLQHIDNSSLWKSMDKSMDRMLERFANMTDTISIQRCSISNRCAKFAEHQVGVCKLIVPTGGGKTLSSLRFAIKQCLYFGKKQVFYIAPFMSILEQNSEVIEALTGKENFLEHHSNLAAEIDDENEYNAYQLSAERWDSPVIATTMVQFLNTLFSGKTSSVRRMHRLSNAVIIIDEVQSVPLKCTHLFSLAVNFLAKVCKSTIVLCSATQPTFDKNRYKIQFDELSEMTGDHTLDFQIFHRNDIVPKLETNGYDFEEAAEFCRKRFEENNDLLLIVNTKAQALNMYKLLKEKLKGRAFLFHLSTNMCPKHRKKRINTLRRFLKRKLPVICVTTQLIEAGVDISFSCVVRSIAGLDNAAQAAGRCNRNGEKGRICPVYIINFKNEQLGSLNEIKAAQRITRCIINSKKDLLSPKTQNEYYQQLFSDCSERLDYTVGEVTLLDLLSLNKSRWEIYKDAHWELAQAFKTAGRLFEVIDQNTEAVLVPYDKNAKDIIASLNNDPTPAEISRLIRKAQKYTVSIYAGNKKALIENGAIYVSNNGINILDKRFYNSEFGITTEGSQRELLIY